MEELISQTETMRVRSALEELPKDVFQDICGYIPAVAQAFFALAVTNKQFKDFMDTPRCLIVFALCSTFGCGVERNVAAGRKFYAKAAANGSVEGMVMTGDSCLSNEDVATAEQWFRSALAREGDPQDGRHFIVLGTPANAFAAARFKVALVLREGADGEPCPEAISLLQSVIEVGPPKSDVECPCSPYFDAVVLLAEMTVKGQAGAAPSLEGAMKVVEAVAEPNGGCHVMMGRIHMMTDPTGEHARTAYSHFVRGLELGDRHAAGCLASIYQDGHGIPDDHFPMRMFYSYICLLVGCYHYKDYHASQNAERMEDAATNHPDHPQFMFFLEVKLWVFEHMGEWMDLGPGSRGTTTLLQVLSGAVNLPNDPGDWDWHEAPLPPPATHDVGPPFDEA